MEKIKNEKEKSNKVKQFFHNVWFSIKRFFKWLLSMEGFVTFLTSILCILIGLIIGYLVLLFINYRGATEGILTLIQNFMSYSKPELQIKYFGLTLAQTAPLIMTGLSILFAYKAGLFNIGAAGQYTMGACACLISALVFKLPWYVCLLFAVLAGAIWGSIVGMFKTFLNVNEVISAIMLNWIGLYLTNILITDSSAWDTIKHETYSVETVNPGAILPKLGLDELFNQSYVTIAIFIAVIVAIIVLIVLNFTTFGYELKATGFNKNAARYCGMKEKKNIILTMAISGGLAGLGASLYFQADLQPWYASSAVPAMGFNGISAAFLGGLNPIGTIFSSYFLSHLTSAGAKLDTNYYSAQVSDLISSVIIYLCAFVGFFKYFVIKKQMDTEIDRSLFSRKSKKLSKKGTK